MTLAANAVMTFTDYQVTDQGILFHFVCANPGPGQPSDYYVLVTDTELAGVSTQQQLVTLVTGKLQRRFRATGIATKLDPLVGQSITI